MTNLMQTISTDRLRIRRFQEGDLVDFLDYQSHPEVLRYMGIEPMSEEKAIRFLLGQAALNDGEKGRYHAFAVVHQADHKVIGDVGFYLDDGPENKGDLGFQFHPAYHHQGYATEAAQALIQFAFQQLELALLTSTCDVRNVASYRLMERLGMKRQSASTQGRDMKGNQKDEFVYALQRDEWLARHALQSNGHSSMDHL